ncbi:hypothetical protein LguiA_031694 [Lonicera macranthoides]
MPSCETSTMFRHKTSLLFRNTPNLFQDSHRNFRNSVKFRCLVDQIVPQFAVLSSLSSVFASGNVIAAAAGSGSVHGAVTSAITDVAVTAIAIASGACLSTKVDFLWPKVEEQPGSLILDGVDVTGYPIFSDLKVQKAISFARKAHHGQLRKTGEPYLTHCIHTGKILAVLVPSTGKRAVDTVVAGILHDVIDDTSESLDTIEREFDDDVAKLVAGVSRLSYINQLLRRHRRINVNQATLGHEENEMVKGTLYLKLFDHVQRSHTSVHNLLYKPRGWAIANNLRVMLLGMVDDPRVVLIKLADRLHNMRTIYALPFTKAQAVAQETLVIWCSLASRLGLWALKAELEDLCFAVLQPQMFRRMRADLASMWSPSTRAGNLRRVSAKPSSLAQSSGENSTLEYDQSAEMDEDDITMKDLLQAVLPFDLLLDRRKRFNFFKELGTCSETERKPKVVRDAGVALASLVVCEEALERELFISTSYVPGMEVTLSSRLKSLYSIYSKMKRKDVCIDKVYDARALRVIVGDKNGALHGQAVKCCYSLLDIVHRLWTPIDGEFDDYIVNPKPSGYQVKLPFSLFKFAWVQGPDNSSLEVQIRTQAGNSEYERMHEYAEHGVAAHWLYKESGNKLPTRSIVVDSEMSTSSFLSKEIEDQDSVEDDIFLKYSSLKAGHPVLRIEGSHLLAAVIVRCLMSGGLNQDMGIGQDQFGRLLPTFIQVIELTEQEETLYWTVVSAVFEGKQVSSVLSDSSFYERPNSDSVSSTSMEAGINNKVHLLRTMLQWEEQLRSEAVGLRQVKHNWKPYVDNQSISMGEVVVVCWPDGEIMRMRTGSTAADAAIRVGLEGKLVSVNGQVVLPNTELKDGDVVEVRE